MGVQVPPRKGAIMRGNGWLKQQDQQLFLQRNLSFGETPDQVHCSCRKLCWKVTKYDTITHILWLAVLCQSTNFRTPVTDDEPCWSNITHPMCLALIWWINLLCVLHNHQLSHVMMWPSYITEINTTSAEKVHWFTEVDEKAPTSPTSKLVHLY